MAAAPAPAALDAASRKLLASVIARLQLLEWRIDSLDDEVGEAESFHSSCGDSLLCAMRKLLPLLSRDEGAAGGAGAAPTESCSLVTRFATLASDIEAYSKGVATAVAGFEAPAQAMELMVASLMGDAKEAAALAAAMPSGAAAGVAAGADAESAAGVAQSASGGAQSAAGVAEGVARAARQLSAAASVGGQVGTMNDDDNDEDPGQPVR